MKGSMMERKDQPGTWRLRVYLGVDGHGRPRQRSKNFKGSRRQAETELARMVVDAGAVPDDLPASLTVGALLDRWLASVEGDLTAATLREHRRCVERVWKPALGSVRVAELGPHAVERLYRSWRDRGLSVGSIHRYHAVLAAACRAGVRWGAIPATRNPMDRVVRPKATRPAVRAVSAGDVAALVDAAEAEGDSVMVCAILLGALTGMRRGELAALRWSSTDLDRSVLTVAESVTVIGREVIVGDTKTHQVRRLGLDPVALEAVRARISRQEVFAAAVGVELVADPWLLSRRSDGAEPPKPDGLSHAFTRYARNLGMPYHLHELRHFHATVGVAAGMDPRTVASRLGHADPALTLRVYAHAQEVGDRALAALVGSAVLAAR